MRTLPGSTYDVHERFKLGMHAKQERDERLNYSNDSVLNTCVFVCFATEQVVLFIEAVPVSTPYCLSPLLALANQISRTVEAPHGRRVYGRNSRTTIYTTRPSNGKHGKNVAVL